MGEEEPDATFWKWYYLNIFPAALTTTECVPSLAYPIWDMRDVLEESEMKYLYRVTNTGLGGVLVDSELRKSPLRVDGRQGGPGRKDSPGFQYRIPLPLGHGGSGNWEVGILELTDS
jgi:hypothetical protein